MPLINRDIPLAAAWPPPRSRADVTAALDRISRRDPYGHRVHLALAVLLLLLLPLSTAGSSIAFALLLVYSIARLPNTWRGHAALTRMPVFVAVLAWTGFTIASVAWSANRGQGLDEIRAARVILLPVLLWPVLGHAPLLVGAALAGVLGQNAVQLLQHLQLFGLVPEAEGRLDGSLHVIQTGAWCAAALAWHASGVLHRGGWFRWISIAAIGAAAAGLLLSGSRGPWIGAAVSVPLAVVVIGARRRAARRPAIVLIVVSLVVAAAASPLIRTVAAGRYESAMREVRTAQDEGVYWSSVGLRIGLWQWAVSIWRQAPLLGTGAGAFQEGLERVEDYVEVRGRAWRNPAHLDWLACSHAHSVYLHTLATTGAAGAALLVVMLCLIGWRCLRDPPDHPYADGHLFALIGWLIGAQFDCYTLNGHLFGLLMLITAVTLAPRPVNRLGGSDSDSRGAR